MNGASFHKTKGLRMGDFELNVDSVSMPSGQAGYGVVEMSDADGVRYLATTNDAWKMEKYCNAKLFNKRVLLRGCYALPTSYSDLFILPYVARVGTDGDAGKLADEEASV